jgi:aspartate aminotransferase
MCLGRPVIVSPQDGTFIPRFEDLEGAVTSLTRAIIVNSPNNPSGAIYPPAFIEKLVDFCEDRGIFLISDDIYQKLTFDNNEAVPAYCFTNKSTEDSHVIVVNGVAKLYGMTGFRIIICLPLIFIKNWLHFLPDEGRDIFFKPST